MQTLTYKYERAYFWVEDGCKICGEKKGRPYRLFSINPNGGYKWIGDFCKVHEKESSNFKE